MIEQMFGTIEAAPNRVRKHSPGPDPRIDQSDRRAAMQSIEWRPVVGLEGHYEVSSDGRVRSLERSITRSDGVLVVWKARVRVTTIDARTGYRKLSLSVSPGVGRTVAVHRLVAEAFVPRADGTRDVCHNDGDRLNNDASNLRWDTHKANMADMLVHGTRRDPEPKIADADLSAVVARRRAGETIKGIGRSLGVSTTAVRTAIRRARAAA